ncbi:uncharacterized protein MELLADRAFT_59652 [Melampsora larici-populina 98AG31]|uniref:F-box domain-containing protein n=1 Tax=Melampsora larici-populina (strain 98AG31 / pathotype 3-4-7) TaxID=747676 RepID=F4R8C4_MELLP|nr:uncharacterized protein MELLADRAFT_59652 [Melampsora larici-populina 98AG31]EGG11466.1 hypothetical protein MELLADRAFT_59652 [Melampsora larici-populina 98AG31]
MPSSSRTTQLALWREIVSKRHAGTTPVNRHLDFIRRRFDELESNGFIWSKESILGIFLQIGLSESSHGPFSSVDKLLDSRILQGLETSSSEVEEVIRNEEFRHKSHRVGLMDLPVEVFNNIVEHLDCMAKLEAEEIEEKREEGQVMIYGSAGRKPYWTYLHQHPPILNTIQNFSLISRENLQFPTSLPAPIDLWTNDILLRHGSYVQSLSLMLSQNCSVPLGGPVDYDPFYDNLITDFQDDPPIKWISPKNIRDLIDRCPNLSTLRFHFDYDEPFEDEGRRAAFMIDLVPLLASLKQLRHLTLEDDYASTIENEVTSKVIQSLPLLESFTCTGHSTSDDDRKLDNASFGFNLSKLKSLSRLNLCRIDIHDNWCLYNWPRTITELTIHDCWRLLPSTAHGIIQHITPHLRKLDISFYYAVGDDIGAVDPAWNPQIRFSLPVLADLKISPLNATLLDSFQNCLSMSCLQGTYKSLEHCQSLNKILSKAPWPQLKTLVVRPHSEYLSPTEFAHQYQEIEDQLVLLEKYCEQGKIEALILRRTERDW